LNKLDLKICGTAAFCQLKDRENHGWTLQWKLSVVERPLLELHDILHDIADDSEKLGVDKDFSASISRQISEVQKQKQAIEAGIKSDWDSMDRQNADFKEASKAEKLEVIFSNGIISIKLK